jgi:hypothetical protein
MALSDVMRFSAILIYFPIRGLMRRNFDLFLGWIMGASIILALLIIALAVAPYNIRILLSTLWIKAPIIYTYTYYDINRATFTISILCFIGYFLGFMYAIDYKQPFWKQILGFILSALSVSVYVINFIRGLILSIAIVLIFVICLSFLRKIYLFNLFRIVIINILFITTGYYFTVNYIPIAQSKWSIAKKNIVEIVDPVRIEQTEKMLEVWIEEPFLGKGVGMPVPGYARSSETENLAFEVQYPMVLYRVGILGFIIIFLPFVFVIYRTIFVWINYNLILKTNLGKLFMAVAFSIIALLISSWFNPYFASVMTPFFVALFLALDDSIGTLLYHSLLYRRLKPKKIGSIYKLI